MKNNEDANKNVSVNISMFEDIGNKIDVFFTKKGITSYKVAQDTGISETSIGRYRKGISNPTSTKLKKIIMAYPELEQYLQGLSRNIPNVNNVEPVSEEDYMMVEYIDLETAAGMLGLGVIDNLPEKHKRLVPREYDKGQYLVVRICGDSMDDGTSRSLKNGDEILVRLWTELPQYLPIKRKLFVINTHNGSVIKQITSINYDDKCITLHSFNSEFEDYVVNFEDILQIFTVEKIVNSKINF